VLACSVKENVSTNHCGGGKGGNKGKKKNVSERARRVHDVLRGRVGVNSRGGGWESPGVTEYVFISPAIDVGGKGEGEHVGGYREERNQ